MLELPKPVDNAASMATRMSAFVLRAMNGCKVYVLFSAPNLKRLDIHDPTFNEGQLLGKQKLSMIALRLKFFAGVMCNECLPLVFSGGKKIGTKALVNTQ